MYSALYLLLVSVSLLGYGLGKPYASTHSQVIDVHTRSRRQIDGTSSLVDFEVRKSSLESAAEILGLTFCDGDHLAGVICPGEEEDDDPTCVSWWEICNGVQVCGLEEYDACVNATEEQYGVPWHDYCRGDEKVDFCRLKDFQPVRCGADYILKKDAAPVKIFSRNYDSDYPNSAFCFWRFTAKEGESIKVDVKDFFSEWNYDMLNIGKGRDYLSTDADILLVNKHSGEGLPVPAVFKTSTNEVFISFFSDAYENERGFKIFVSVAGPDDDVELYEPRTPPLDTDCGNSSIIDLSQGQEYEIYSPGQPEHYAPFMQCDWRFEVDPGRRIGFRVIRMDTENQADLVTIGSGESVGDADNVVSRLGGTAVPKKPVVVADSNAWLRFTSDAAIERSGFTIKVSEVPAAECGGSYKVPADGSVMVASPNYPDLAYRLNQDCVWSFKAAPGRKLTVQFLDFRTQLYGDPVSAGFGPEPAFDWSNFVVEEHTGRKMPEPVAFDTGEDAAWISFRSDSFLVDRGFKALVGDTKKYKAGFKAEPRETHPLNQNCGQTIRREEIYDEIVITSPRAGAYYPALLDCIWVVDIPFGGMVKIEWDQFLTESGRDFFTLGNGSDPNLASSIIIDRYSGVKAPKKMETYFQSLWVRFQTDLLGNYRGFQFKISPIPYTGCGGLLEVPEGGSLVVASPGYPYYYTNGQTCRYTIQSTSGTRFYVTILKFEVAYEDFLSLGEGCDPAEGGSTMIDKQTITRPDNYQVVPRTAAVWMKFFTNRYRSERGWMIAFSDMGDPVTEERGFGSCEPYTSDPVTIPPPPPTEEPILPEGSGDEAEPAGPEPKYEETEDPETPDWYDDLSEGMEEEEEESTVSPPEEESVIVESEVIEGSGSEVPII